MSTQPDSHLFLASQNVGDRFGGVYFVESANIKQTQHQKNYTDMILRDRSGARNVKFWGTVDGLESGDFVAVIAKVEEYQGLPSIIADEMEVVDAPGDLSDYIASFDVNAKELELAEVIAQIASLGDGQQESACVAIIKEVFTKTGSLYAKFIEAPLNCAPFYGKLGGLLANSVAIAKGCLFAAQSLGFSEEEKELVATSALLHRLGAVDSFSFEKCLPTATKKGMLLGIGNLTFNRLSTVIRKVSQDAKSNGSSLSSDAILRVIHCVVACDGCVRPMTKEAMLLAAQVKTESELAEVCSFIDQDQNHSSEFTSFDSRTGGKYYRG
jgi:23S rRNA maturation-related 3'-5' exoribonuclease YhaM